MNDKALALTVSEANLPGASCAIVGPDGLQYSRSFSDPGDAEKIPIGIDTPCQIASMTKAMVSVCAMQLVEQNTIALDDQVADVLPQLANPDVLDGFDDDGAPKFRKANKAISWRHLLTHTSGLGYIFVQSEILRYFTHVGMPAPGSLKGIEMPLLFDPGEKWEYGVSTDWLGLAIEAVTGRKLRDHMKDTLFDPLGLTQTAFLDAPPDGLAGVFMRAGPDALAEVPIFINAGEYDSGGGGLVSTVQDYARFIQAILRGGELDGQRILQTETMTLMGTNQIGDLRAGHMTSSMPELAGAFDAMPDQHTGWGLGFLLNPETGPDGRAPGSMAWAGIFNSYYWIDPASRKGGLFFTQLSPFGDERALKVFSALERMAYDKS